VIYSKEFFKIQLAFAIRVKELKNISLEKALFDFTMLYKVLKLPRPIDPENKEWLAFVELFSIHELNVDKAFDFYRATREIKHKSTDQKQTEKWFGYFRYEIEAEDAAISIHFDSGRNTDKSPYSRTEINERRNEVQQLLKDVVKSHPNIHNVRGAASWMYNLPIFNELFPKEWINSATAVVDKFDSLALWGQFLRRDGTVREDIATAFYDSMEKATSEEQLYRSFPYKVFKLGYIDIYNLLAFYNKR